ncbi:substrate-binding domain-containing protein [Micromonospora sp. KLBMP9576]|uniref:substrate-binding domain-containing protein n=1 Tax=Micromonospora sp. KLBMP9576 TaxID=3424769 RepID=UPI003D8BA320
MSYAFTDPFAVRFLAGVAQAAERHGTNLLLVPLPPGEADARRAVENAAVDGFCVYCVGDEGWLVDVLRERGLPVVTTAPRDDAGPGPDERYVGIDERAAARAAAAHVAGLGHRRVALLGDAVRPDAAPGEVHLADVADVAHPTTRARLAGFADAFAEVGVAWSELTVLAATDNSRSAGAAAVAATEPPTAVLACADVLALGVLDAIADAGGPPISVTGFDDIAEAATAGLTTVRQPAEEKGRTAAQLLLDPPADPAAGHVLLPTTLVVRSSTGPARRS